MDGERVAGATSTPIWNRAASIHIGMDRLDPSTYRSLLPDLRACEADARAITILGCMATIMPKAQTSACLTLSTLNDDGIAMALCFRPLHDAVQSDDIEMVRLLLSCGADPQLSTFRGLSIWDVAHSPEMQQFLTGK